MLAQKGPNARAEVETAISAINLLGGGPIKIMIDKSSGEKNDDDVQVNNVHVVIKKIKQTPDKYPRRIGVPAKHPL
jgi:16S rRNA (guanine527-N7)-methyltransferase